MPTSEILIWARLVGLNRTQVDRASSRRWRPEPSTGGPKTNSAGGRSWTGWRSINCGAECCSVGKLVVSIDRRAFATCRYANGIDCSVVRYGGGRASAKNNPNGLGDDHSLFKLAVGNGSTCLQSNRWGDSGSQSRRRPSSRDRCARLRLFGRIMGAPSVLTTNHDGERIAAELEISAIWRGRGSSHLPIVLGESG